MRNGASSETTQHYTMHRGGSGRCMPASTNRGGIYANIKRSKQQLPRDSYVIAAKIECCGNGWIQEVIRKEGGRGALGTHPLHACQMSHSYHSAAMKSDMLHIIATERDDNVGSLL